jgi:hypothetical protein
MVMLFDRFNLPEDVLSLIFATEQQVIVARELLLMIKEKGGSMNKTEMGLVAQQLHDGVYECELTTGEYKGRKVKLSYNKRQFYDRILTPMKGMGMIEYDIYKKIYKLSDKFNKDMLKIGLMWLKELR